MNLSKIHLEIEVTCYLFQFRGRNNVLRINEINISNINSITSLNLKFQSGVNILCGTNGIGKTTILNCINHSINSRRNLRLREIRSTVNSSESFFDISATVNDLEDRYFFNIGDSLIADNWAGNTRINSNMLIYHDISGRQYRRNPLRISEGRIHAMSTYDLIKGWFYNCYFKKESMSNEKFGNLLLAKKVFSQLDSDVTFVEATESKYKRFNDRIDNVIEIMVETSKGTINMDFLSTGYKACFCILFGIIRRIEKFNIAVDKFDGVILIDEIDLHLHPEWQSKIVEILKWLTPKSQIIITTHSPHVVQNAAQGEIIPLGIDENYRMFVRELPESNEFGYQGWTIEEILVYVMGLKDPRSKVFLEKLNQFEKALNNEDTESIKQSYAALNSMIHYRNPLSTVLRIQAGEFLDEEVTGQ